MKDRRCATVCWRLSRPTWGATVGAGELLLTSMDRDGTGLGYDTDLVTAVASSVRSP